MNVDNLDYKRDLFETKKLYEDYKHQNTLSAGFTVFDSTSAGDTLIVKQNNTLIHLLISISEKLDRILNTPKPVSEEKLVKDLDDITNKLVNINLGTRGTRKTSGKP